jgi:hypothetical protein
VQSPTPPVATSYGDRWLNTDTGTLYTWTSDANGDHWVELF